MRGKTDEEDGDQPLEGFILWAMGRSQGFIISRMTDPTCSSEGNFGSSVGNGLGLRERQREMGGSGGDKCCLLSSTGLWEIMSDDGRSLEKQHLSSERRQVPLLSLPAMTFRAGSWWKKEMTERWLV